MRNYCKKSVLYIVQIFQVIRPLLLHSHESSCHKQQTYQQSGNDSSQDCCDNSCPALYFISEAQFAYIFFSQLSLILYPALQETGFLFISNNAVAEECAFLLTCKRRLIIFFFLIIFPQTVIDFYKIFRAVYVLSNILSLWKISQCIRKPIHFYANIPKCNGRWYPRPPVSESV